MVSSRELQPPLSPRQSSPLSGLSKTRLHRARLAVRPKLEEYLRSDGQVCPVPWRTFFSILSVLISNQWVAYLRSEFCLGGAHNQRSGSWRGRPHGSSREESHRARAPKWPDQWGMSCFQIAGGYPFACNRRRLLCPPSFRLKPWAGACMHLVEHERAIEFHAEPSPKLRGVCQRTPDPGPGRAGVGSLPRSVYPPGFGFGFGFAPGIFVSRFFPGWGGWG